MRPMIILALLLAPPAHAAEEPPPPCDGQAAFGLLAFWVGDWVVEQDGEPVGENSVRYVEGGCAIEERWASVSGTTGRSLFYYVPMEDRWEQVWVTPYALMPGGVKERSLIAVLEDGSLRFQGEIALEGGGSYLDRTTLTPRENGTVRQLIETSTDGGDSWRTSFDAIYRSVETEGRPRP